jgi:two-component system, chemotaxis family, sensor kinase CheA
VSEAPTEFLELFREEASERLDNMVSRLLELERGEPTAEPVKDLFREAHTIKGAAGMLGLDEVHDLAHALEDVLSDVRDAGEFPGHLADPLLRSIDTMRRQISGVSESPMSLIAELGALRRDHPLTAGATEAPPPLTSPSGTIRRSVHVPAEKIDRLLDLVGETALHRSRLEYVLSENIGTRPAIIDELDAGARLLDELKEAAVGMRTLPLASIVGSFPRAVRDLALTQDKDVELVLAGTDTELDRTILQTLPEMLIHLLRNAVAHGIESSPEREHQGKPPRGVITLSAEQRGSEVEITVSDDGRGVAKELLDEAQHAGSLADVLGRTGYSTAGAVTSLAGRGVGLDAVRTQVEGFGGRVEVRSEAGRGTKVTLLLPLALALLEMLLVERGGRVYGIPLSAVQEVLSVGQGLVLEGRPAVDLRGSPVSFFDLADVVGATAEDLQRPTPAAVVAVGERRAVLACDHLIGQEEIVVKPLGLLGPVEGYVGGAILGDGRIALLLDLNTVFRSQRRARTPVPHGDVPPPALAPKVLVVEDFFTVRELQRSILEAAGYRVATAENGRDALGYLDTDDEVALVITDVEMPVMDGFALTEAIRRDPRHRSLPVIIVTTRDSAEDRERGLTAGADAYMAKHAFRQQSLLEAVERLVGR